MFLEIGRDTLATSYRAAFLLFAALVQHARRPRRVRRGKPASRRGEILNDLPDRISDIVIFVGVALAA